MNDLVAIELAETEQAHIAQGTMTGHGKIEVRRWLNIAPGLIVDWSAREGGGVWATVRLPLLQTMEEMVALVGKNDDVR